MVTLGQSLQAVTIAEWCAVVFHRWANGGRRQMQLLCARERAAAAGHIAESGRTGRGMAVVACVRGGSVSCKRPAAAVGPAFFPLRIGDCHYWHTQRTRQRNHTGMGKLISVCTPALAGSRPLAVPCCAVYMHSCSSSSSAPQRRPAGTGSQSPYLVALAHLLTRPSGRRAAVGYLHASSRRGRARRHAWHRQMIVMHG